MNKGNGVGFFLQSHIYTTGKKLSLILSSAPPPQLWGMNMPFEHHLALRWWCQWVTAFFFFFLHVFAWNMYKLATFCKSCRIFFFFGHFIGPWNSSLGMTPKCSIPCFLQARTCAYRKQWRVYTRPSMWLQWREKFRLGASDLGGSLWLRTQPFQSSGKHVGIRALTKMCQLPWSRIKCSRVASPQRVGAGRDLLCPAAQGQSLFPAFRVRTDRK